MPAAKPLSKVCFVVFFAALTALATGFVLSMRQQDY
jgi:hypothetical protein